MMFEIILKNGHKTLYNNIYNDDSIYNIEKSWEDVKEHFPETLYIESI